MEIKITKGEAHRAHHHDHDHDHNDDDDQKLPLLHLKDIPFPDEVERTRIQQALSQAFQSFAHLAKRLPTGTLMAFQLLSPIFTNQGQCNSSNRAMTSALIVFCGLSCFLLSFTDTLRDKNGNVSHGVATFGGFWLIDGKARVSTHVGEKYRLRLVDFVHAFMTVLVFVTVALFDKNTVQCFCPTPSQETRDILTLLPVGIGVLCGVLFVVFPTQRHGIGFPLSPN